MSHKKMSLDPSPTIVKRPKPERMQNTRMVNHVTHKTDRPPTRRPEAAREL
jgi:hypothetical protein